MSDLHEAIEKGDLARVKGLIEKGVQIIGGEKDNELPILYYALRLGEVDIFHLLLKTALKQEFDVNAQDKKGLTPLYYAAYAKDGKFIDQLIKLKANVNVKIGNSAEDSDGENQPLHVTISVGNVDGFKKLLEVGVDVNARGYCHITALHLAILIRNIDFAKKSIHGKTEKAYKEQFFYHDDSGFDFVEALLKAGADINAKAIGEFTPLHVAASIGNLNVTEILLKEVGVDINATSDKRQTALHYAVQNKKLVELKFVRLLLGEEDNIDSISYRNVISHCTVQNENYDVIKIVKLLLENGAIVDMRDIRERTALHLISRSNIFGTLEIVKLLLEHNANINAIDIYRATVLHFVAQSNNPNIELTKLLIEKGIDIHAVNNCRNTVLHFIAFNKGNNAIKFAELMLEKLSLYKINGQSSCNVNSQNDKGETPVHCVIKGSRNRDILELFLSEEKINLAVKNYQGQTVLHYVVDREDVIEKILLKDGSIINVADTSGNTALHWAASGNYQGAVNLLIKYGANVNVQNEEGKTPLHYAAALGSWNMAIIGMLLENGANVNIEDKKGETALDYAVDMSNLNCVVVLLTAESDVGARSDKFYKFIKKQDIEVLVSLWEGVISKYNKECTMFKKLVQNFNISDMNSVMELL